MCEIINYTKYRNDLLQKIFGNSAGLLLSRLIYWSEHKNKYGILKNGKVWIYNTLENWAKQLNYSKKTIQRAVKFLKTQNIIDSDYFAQNKRDRTLFYSVNYENLLKIVDRPKNKVYMNVHMYNRYKKQKNYKSNNSEILIEKKESAIDSLNHHLKPTIVQDMIKIWNKNFPNSKFCLTTHLSKHLVAAFKQKFKESLDEWNKYINLIKTSKYLINEKFSLTLNWCIKFFTIDRLNTGDLGVNNKIAKIDDSQMKNIEEENLKNALNHIEFSKESEKCKQVRREIIKTLSPAKYNSWFVYVDLYEKDNSVIMQIQKGHEFAKNYISLNFSHELGLCFLD